jgi:Icc-related predicted phosphoesterase
MSERVTRLLCAAEPRGSAEAIERLRDVAADGAVDATVIVGDLGGGPDRSKSHRSVFRALVGVGSPVYWVPGPGDAPISVYLREAYNIEIVSPLLRGVHGTLAFKPGQPIVAGMGGEISDDPGASRHEVVQGKL